MSPFKKGAKRLVRTLFGLPPAKSPKRIRKQTRLVADPHLLAVWINLRRRWFPSRKDLDDYCVVWSSRAQKRTLASCSLHRKRVVVARELNYPEHECWLAPLVYHEMCHAVLGDSIAKRGEKTQWHGEDFRRLEECHPQIEPLNDWIRSGGWAKAVRSDRAKRRHSRK